MHRHDRTFLGAAWGAFAHTSGVIMILLAISLAGFYISGDASKIHRTQPASQPRGNVEVLAVTESGTTVYRVDGPRAIVPVVWVESKEGHVSIR